MCSNFLFTFPSCGRRPNEERKIRRNRDMRRPSCDTKIKENDHKLARSFSHRPFRVCVCALLRSWQRRRPPPPTTTTGQRRWRRIRRRKLVWKVVLRDYVVSGFELKFTNTFVCAANDWYVWIVYAMVCGQSADGSTASVVVIVRFIGHFMRCRWHSFRACAGLCSRSRALLVHTHDSARLHGQLK